MLVKTKMMDTIVQIANNVDILRNRVNYNAFYTVPHVGDYKFSARTDDFHGWLKCDGRTVNISDYQGLYEVIGTSFGNNGAGTFKLPRGQGRVPGAIGSTGNVGDSNHPLGDRLGAETHVLQESEMPSHTHTGTTSTNGSHNHGGATGSVGGTGAQGIAALGGGNDVAEDGGSHSHSISNDGAHNHTFTTAETGGDQPHNNMQPTIYLGNMYIFAGIGINANVDPIVVV
jgi:microcystin-dependent protein